MIRRLAVAALISGLCAGSALAQTDGSVPGLTKDEAINQRAIELMQELGLPIRPVSPDTALRSAQHAHRLREATGAMPKIRQGAPGDGLIVFKPRNRSYKDRFQQVTPRYFAVWDDLMQRCFSAVTQHRALDARGLAVTGEDRLDLNEAFSEQQWFSEDKAFTVKLQTEYAREGRPKPLWCIVQTNRFAMVESRSVMQLTQQFYAWWQAAGYAALTEGLEYPFNNGQTHPRHHWFGGRTAFGTVNGCALVVELSEITIARETKLSVHIREFDKTGCILPPLPRQPQTAPPAAKPRFVIPDGPAVDL